MSESLSLPTGLYWVGAWASAGALFGFVEAALFVGTVSALIGSVSLAVQRRAAQAQIMRLMQEEDADFGGGEQMQMDWNTGQDGEGV